MSRVRKTYGQKDVGSSHTVHSVQIRQQCTLGVCLEISIGKISHETEKIALHGLDKGLQ